jgi:hypothetical protein
MEVHYIEIILYSNIYPLYIYSLSRKLIIWYILKEITFESGEHEVNINRTWISLKLKTQITVERYVKLILTHEMIICDANDICILS